MSASDIVNFFLQLEGPYRWYVIGGILIVLTAIITRFIFKTFKWFLLIVAAAIVVIAIIQYFTPIDLLEVLGGLK
jgi:uncharacterized membrane protein YdbT with pleckstrin-like domain